MNEGETVGTAQSRATRLLAIVREHTEKTNEPVFVAELAAACQLTVPEVQAAWSYLRDHGFIETFSIPYTARISTRGIDALDRRNTAGANSVGNVGVLSAALEGATMCGYGRVDSQEGLDRAREVSNELRRLHEFLPKLTNSELSAYSTKSLPIGTFLNSKGHAFSVLTEDMLANQFKEELDRRKGDTTSDRWLKKLKNNRFTATFVVLAIATAGVATFVESLGKLETTIHPAPTPAPAPLPGPEPIPNMDLELARDRTIQIDLCAFDRGKEEVVECVTHGACKGPGAQGLGFPIDKTSKDSAVYTCKQSCVTEAKRLNARCATPPPF